MANLDILNKATREQRGGGIPFYESLDFLLVREKTSSTLSSCAIPWYPNNKIPSFQLWLKYGQSFTLEYLEIKGSVLTGVSFTPNLIIQPDIKEAQVNGVDTVYIVSFPDITMVSGAPVSTWVIKLEVEDPVDPGDPPLIQTVYSEVFRTTNC